MKKSVVEEKGNKSISGFTKRDGKPYGCIIIDLGGAIKLVNLENRLQQLPLKKLVGRSPMMVSWRALVAVGIMMMMMVAS